MARPLATRRVAATLPASVAAGAKRPRVRTQVLADPGSDLTTWNLEDGLGRDVSLESIRPRRRVQFIPDAIDRRP